MQSLAECQSRFAAALLDPDLELPEDLRGPPRSAPGERFAVYRNNVAVGLIEALRSSFPVVNQLVGAEFFGAMARIHAQRCPPSSPVLLAYGRDFPAFIAEFETAAALPYLADVARLEWLWLEAYHAEEAVPIGIEDLRRVSVDHIPDMHLICHPSVRYACLTGSALTIWRAHQGPGEPDEVHLDAMTERLLVARPHAEVEVIALSPGALVFLQTVQRGSTITQAVSCALGAEPELVVAQMFALLFGAGTFTGFVLDHDPAARERS